MIEMIIMIDLPLCQCGCGEMVTKMGNKFIHGHNNRRETYWKTQQEPKLCACGCGELANPGRDYINGHNKNRLGEKWSQESIIKLSKATLGVPKPPRTPEHCAAISAAKLGVPNSPEHCAAIKNSDAMQLEHDRQRGGNDIVDHHYIYDHDDLSKNTVKMTRSDHSRLHWLLWRLGVDVPHINRK